MISKNFLVAAVTFFAWLFADSASSLLLDRPLPGIYYPMESGTLKSVGRDWSKRSRWGAPIVLAAFAGMWALLINRTGIGTGLRLAALISAFVMVPFWVVTLASADLYDLSLNGYWVASMVYANVSFLLYGFVGRGRAKNLSF